jgi:hypothetical protein
MLTMKKKTNRARNRPQPKPPEKAIWKMMTQRCTNPRYAGGKHYGVPICERWFGPDGYANFLADVGPQPFAGAGLRRLDEEVGFAPGNVTWSNTRTTHILTHEGRSMSIAEWSQETGINERTLRERFRRGWPVQRILSCFVEDRDHLGWYGTRKKHRDRQGDHNK